MCPNSNFTHNKYLQSKQSLWILLKVYETMGLV